MTNRGSFFNSRRHVSPAAGRCRKSQSTVGRNKWRFRWHFCRENQGRLMLMARMVVLVGTDSWRCHWPGDYVGVLFYLVLSLIASVDWQILNKWYGYAINDYSSTQYRFKLWTFAKLNEVTGVNCTKPFLPPTPPPPSNQYSSILYSLVL